MEYPHADCFCAECMAVDRVRGLQVNMAKAMQSLRALRQAQRPTPADMAQQITAQAESQSDAAPRYSPAMCPHGVKWGFGECIQCDRGTEHGG